MSDAVTRVHAREVLAGDGSPTLEVEVTTASGATGRAAVPAGLGGDGSQTLAAVTGEVARVLAGRDVLDQEGADRALAGSQAGASATLGASLALAHAAAAGLGVPLWKHLDADGRAALPLPVVTLMSGGDAGGDNMDLRGVLLVPAGAKSFSAALASAAAVSRKLGQVLRLMGYEGLLTAETGAYAPKLPANRWALEVLVKAVEEAGLKPGRDAAIAIDAGATRFYKDGLYVLTERKQKPRDADGMVNLFRGWMQDYPIVSVADPVAADDWPGWARLTAALTHRLEVVGGDVFAADPDRLKRGVAEGAANAVAVDLGRAGTLTRALAVARRAREAGYRVIVSAGGGETPDATAADLAVAVGAAQVRFGGLARAERVAKYNQLLRAEEALGGPGVAPFAGVPAGGAG